MLQEWVEERVQTSAKDPISRVQKRVVCVDLFAGAGGFSLAAQNVGWHVAAAIELDRHACDTYRRNFEVWENGTGGLGTRLYSDDIADLQPEKLINEVPALKKGCDIILGGPPCQGFSVHRFRDRGVDDPRNALIIRYFDFVSALSPKAFLVENVPGLLWPRHKEFLDKFYEAAQAADYEVFPAEKLDARDYGVPQRRKRVFILGIRKDVGVVRWPPPPSHGDEHARAKNPELLPWVISESIFSDPAPKDDPNDIHMKHTPELVEVFKNTPPNGGSRSQSGRTLPCHKKHNGHSDVYGRIDPMVPGPTMTTACINPSKGRFVHPKEHHGITLRQAARFQTFPDTFVFNGGLMAAGMQIGNAVPILLGEAILRHISATVFREKRRISDSVIEEVLEH